MSVRAGAWLTEAVASFKDLETSPGGNGMCCLCDLRSILYAACVAKDFGEVFGENCLDGCNLVAISTLDKRKSKRRKRPASIRRTPASIAQSRRPVSCPVQHDNVAVKRGNAAPARPPPPPPPPSPRAPPPPPPPPPRRPRSGGGRPRWESREMGVYHI